MSTKSLERKGLLDAGILMLLFEIVTSKTLPPVVLSLTIFQILLHVGLIPIPWKPWESCLSVQYICGNHDYWRIIMSAFEHGHSLHLYFNMSTFMTTGRVLETKYHSRNFFVLIMILVIMTGSLYVLIAEITSYILSEPLYIKACVIGFSGVLFALKVILAWESPCARSFVRGVFMPPKFAYWLELIIIHYFTPRSSLLGHLSGIIAGLIYCHFVCTYDQIIFSITEVPINHGPWDDDDVGDPTEQIEEFMNSLEVYEWNHRFFTSPTYFSYKEKNKQANVEV